MRQLTQKQLDSAIELISSHQRKTWRNASNKEALAEYERMLEEYPELHKIPEFRMPLDSTEEDASEEIKRTLRGMRLDGLKIKMKQVFMVDFDRCSMQRMDLSSIEFTECSFYHADLEGSDLSEAYLFDCYVSFTSFKRCDMSEIKIAHSSQFDSVDHLDFSMANLAAARLYDLDLRQADFHMANLMEAEFEGCELSFCNMATTNHIHATFKNCTERGNIE